jgi:hypothetical protein
MASINILYISELIYHSNFIDDDSTVTDLTDVISKNIEDNYNQKR